MVTTASLCVPGGLPLLIALFLVLSPSAATPLGVLCTFLARPLARTPSEAVLLSTSGSSMDFESDRVMYLPSIPLAPDDIVERSTTRIGGSAEPASAVSNWLESAGGGAALVSSFGEAAGGLLDEPEAPTLLCFGATLLVFGG